MGNYPFDTQKCQIKMNMKGNSGSFAEQVVENLNYLGPIDLTQYFVKNWDMTKNKDVVQVEIMLGMNLYKDMKLSVTPKPSSFRPKTAE